VKPITEPTANMRQSAAQPRCPGSSDERIHGFSPPLVNIFQLTNASATQPRLTRKRSAEMRQFPITARTFTVGRVAL